MFGPISHVVFDFDGTLVDTMPSVIKGLGQAIEHVTGQLPVTEELEKTFGAAPQAVLEKWIPKERVADAFKYWMEFETNLASDEMLAFSGVDEMLQGIVDKNISVGLFTGRDRAGTLRILKARSWYDKYFTDENIVCGDDGHKTKPAPDALLYLLQKMNWAAERTLLIGDHAHDMTAGRLAGVKTAAVLWDMPPSKTPRAQYKAVWKKWDNVDCDLRLSSPLSLLEWVSVSAK
jgi:HAD superfamily hydrolase (TIGR01549 family)